MLRFLVVAITFIAVFYPMIVSGRDNGQWGNVDPAIRQWYETRELTPAAQKRLHYVSCCAHADVVKTQFRVEAGSAIDQWFWLTDAGSWSEVPTDIIHWHQHSPTGEPVLFAVGGRPVCFFPPDAGI